MMPLDPSRHALGCDATYRYVTISAYSAQDGRFRVAMRTNWSIFAKLIHVRWSFTNFALKIESSITNDSFIMTTAA
jgi:hypothetical protein